MKMRNLRELVLALRARDGVRAAVVLGRDGLVIESDAEPSISTDLVAAHVPTLMNAAAELGSAAAAGSPQSAVLLQERGICIASQLSAEVHIAVLLNRDSPFGEILFELSRDRDRISAMV